MTIPKRPFYFLRHGQTDWNVEKRFQGHKDIPLNTVGIEQAHDAGRRLSQTAFSRVISSPLDRAKRTAEIVVTHTTTQLTVATHDGLKERFAGPWEGMLWSDILKECGLEGQWDAEVAPHPDSESYDAMNVRIMSALREILTDDNILIVAHGGVFHALQHICFGHKGMHTPNATPYLFQPTANGWELREIK